MDTDPQANATLGLGIHPGTPARTIYQFYIDQCTQDEPLHLSEYICRTVSGIDLVPSHLDLIGAEPALYHYPHRYEILGREISHIKDRYDHILIDTPPFLGQFMINGLIAADRNVLVFSPDSFSLNGFENIRLIISDIEELLGKKIQIHMAVLNRWYSPPDNPGILEKLKHMFTRASPDHGVPGDEIRNLMENQLLRDIPTIIKVPDSRLITDSQKNGMPLAFSQPDDLAAQAFAQIAEHLDTGR